MAHRYGRREFSSAVRDAAVRRAVGSFHCLDIQLISGIAGNAQPNPAIT